MATTVDSDDVIANALRASHVIQLDDSYPSPGIENEERIKKFIPLTLPGGQIFYLEETSTSDFCTEDWISREPDETNDSQNEDTPLCCLLPDDSICSAVIDPSFISSADLNAADSTGESTEAALTGNATAGGCKNLARWSDEKTQLLISLVKQFEKEFKGRARSKGNIWQTIADTMSPTYSDVDKDLCYKKWSNMLRTFRAYKKRRDHSWKYYKDVEKLSSVLETHAISYKEIRRRLKAFRQTKVRIKKFIDVTNDNQEAFNACIVKFQGKVKDLQKQSDGYLETIFNLFEQHFCDTKNAFSIADDLSSQVIDDVQNSSEPEPSFVEVPELEGMSFQFFPVVDQSSTISTEKFQLISATIDIVSEDTVDGNIASNTLEEPNEVGTQITTNEISPFYDETTWERMDSVEAGTNPLPNLSDECIQGFIKVSPDSSSDSESTGNSNIETKQQLIFTTTSLKGLNSVLQHFGRIPQSMSMYSRTSVTETDSLLPQTNTTYQFVPITDETTSMEDPPCSLMPNEEHSSSSGGECISTDSVLPSGAVSAESTTDADMDMMSTVALGTNHPTLL